MKLSAEMVSYSGMYTAKLQKHHRGEYMAHLAQDGLIVNAGVDDSATCDVLLILLALLYCDIVLLQVLVAAEALHCLLCQVACTGKFRGSMNTLNTSLKV